jgi:hypothetical protein
MNDDVFGILTSNASFDFKRFEKDVKYFKGSKGTTTEGSARAGSDKAPSGKTQGEGGAKRDLYVVNYVIYEIELLYFRYMCHWMGLVDSTAQANLASLEVATIDGEMDVKVSGSKCPSPIDAFEELNKSKKTSRLVQNIRELGISTPTLVQRYSIPCILQHHDLYAIAPTGSGKTLAFLAPGVHCLRMWGANVPIQW